MRLRERTEAMPKALVEIGGRPILWHIMRSYAHYGFCDFVLALGHLGDQIKEYFADHRWRESDVQLGRGSLPELNVHNVPEEDWCVTLADTGVETGTGGRLRRLRPHLREQTFFATYGDGLSDIDLVQLLAFHRSHGRIATLSVVTPRLNFGLVDIDADQRVTRFREKPLVNGWINGGFFVFEPAIFEYLDNDSMLEQEPMRRLAAAGELMAFRHERFWACMDTYKDEADLNAAWASGRPPWRVWAAT